MFEVKIRILNFVFSISLEKRTPIKKQVFKSNILSNPNARFVDKVEYVIDNYSLKKSIKAIQKLPEYKNKYYHPEEFAKVMRTLSDKKKGYTFNNFLHGLHKYQ